MINDIDFYRNPTPYDLIKNQDNINWEQLSILIERDFLSTEIRLFYDKINIASYLSKHDISDEEFIFLQEHDRITFIDRYRLCHKYGRINDNNIELICGEHNSLWARAFRYNDISEDVLIRNFNIISPNNSDFKKIAAEKISEENDDKYVQLMLLLELND